VTAAGAAEPLRRRPLEAKASRVRPARFLLPAYTWLVLAYTIVPIAIMVAYSFNQAHNSRVSFAWQGFTTTWYSQVFALGDLTTAFEHSLEIATGSTVISLLLGVPLALALARYRWRGGFAVDSVIFIDIAAPSVVVGASLLSLFITLNVPRGLLTILIAHIAFNVAYVTVVVRARALGLDPAIEKAAADLGAGPWTAFRTVTLPLLLPGIVAAGLLAFAMSIDDFIITQFVAGSTQTFPLYVFGASRIGIPPQVFVMGSLIFAVGVLIAIANVVLQRRTQL
jgi:spermidine/putrescine transport system permease protein